MLRWLIFCFFCLQLVHGFLLREVPTAISDRCQALAMEMRSMPEEDQQAFHELEICKPEFKLWFWQTPDEQALIFLEHMVLIIRARQRQMAILCTSVVAFLLTVLLMLRKTLAWIWRNPFLAILRISAPFYDTAWQSFAFFKTLGWRRALLLTSCALLCTVYLSKFYFVQTYWQCIQVFALMILLWNFILPYMVVRCYFRLRYFNDPWLGQPFLEDIFNENNRNAQNIFNDIAPASIAVFM